jgi:hypothetical protein
MRTFLLIFAAALLAGCAANPFAGYNIQPGTTRGDAVERRS